MAKEKNIQITESTSAAKAKNISAQTTPSIKHPIAEMERAFDRFFGRGFPSLWHGRDFPMMDSLFGDSLLN